MADYTDFVRKSTGFANLDRRRARRSGARKIFCYPPGRLRNRGLSNEVREFHSGAMICLNAASATPQVGSPGVPRSRRASLCRTHDEANPEDEHADGQQYCADIGEIDEPVR